MKTEDFHFVALQLCLFLGIVYFLQTVTGFNPGFNAASSPLYKFFTSFLGHSSLEHLYSNLFFIGLFGSLYEHYTSGKMFLVTFLASALFANLSAFIFFSDSFIIGASGGAMGLLAALAVYRPQQIGLALGIPLPMWAVLIVYILIQFAGLTGVNNTAYEAHLFGLVVGSFIGYKLRSRPLIDMDESNESQDGEWRERIREWEEKWMV